MAVRLQRPAHRETAISRLREAGRGGRAFDLSGRYDQGSRTGFGGGDRVAGGASQGAKNWRAEVMKKRDFVDRVVDEAEATKQAAEAAVGAEFASIAEARWRAARTSPSQASVGSSGASGQRVRAGIRAPASASPSARRPACR